MPKLISEIKCPKLRKLAELRREEDRGEKSDQDCLLKAFCWDASDELYDFWYYVEYDLITELPKDHPLYKKL